MDIIVSRKHIYAQDIYWSKKILAYAWVVFGWYIEAVYSKTCMRDSVFINYTEIDCINIMWNPMIHHFSWPKQIILHSFRLLQDVYSYLNQIWHAKYCKPALKQQYLKY